MESDVSYFKTESHSTHSLKTATFWGCLRKNEKRGFIKKAHIPVHTSIKKKFFKFDAPKSPINMPIFFPRSSSPWLHNLLLQLLKHTNTFPVCFVDSFLLKTTTKHKTRRRTQNLFMSLLKSLNITSRHRIKSNIQFIGIVKAFQAENWRRNDVTFIFIHVPHYLRTTNFL